ncbi:putative flavin-containing monoamine oxidase A [Brachionus plicatilis]|uniref:Amine oxidase n=1 Tax=Brachionus plicatilis TaxID=10195 RepID=A0A3M7QHC8_BRAPC|nr:putative flavin-containing monoamine oxidase A [Brachionus plicatilis]
MSVNKVNDIDPELYDVIIIGAGISGSNAAYQLKKRCQNIKILVLEAKDRMGGRTQTIDVKCSKQNQTSRWDIGGQWVSDSQTNVTKLMTELGIKTYRQFDDGLKLLEANGKISSYNSNVPCSSLWSWIDMQLYMWRVNKDLKKISTIDPFSDKQLASFLDKKSAKEYLYSKSMSATVRSIFTSNMRTIYGLELDQVNALFGMMYVKAGGGNVEAITYSDEGCAQEKRVCGGTQQISEKCMQFVQSVSTSSQNSAGILLNQAVLEVIQDEANDEQPVVVITRNTITDQKTQFRAKKVISTMPVNQYINVKFTPELPYYKRNFFKFFQVGNYIKFLVTYRTHFWRSKGLSGEGTYDGSVKWINEERFREAYKNEMDKLNFSRKMPTFGAVNEVFDGTNEDGEPALIGFIAADTALEWADQSFELRRQEVIEDLARMYGPEARDYVEYVEKNWAYEPFNGGCPCFNVVSSGVMKDYARATREPFQNVHFAGTESATVWQGYMDGAVESGERAANEVLYTLYNNDANVKVDYKKTYYYHKELTKQMDDRHLKENRIISASKYLYHSQQVTLPNTPKTIHPQATNRASVLDVTRKQKTEAAQAIIPTIYKNRTKLSKIRQRAKEMFTKVYNSNGCVNCSESHTSSCKHCKAINNEVNRKIEEKEAKAQKAANSNFNRVYSETNTVYNIRPIAHANIDHLVKSILYETFLKPKNTLEITNFTIYRSHRLNGKGGGASICIKNSLVGSVVDITNHLIHENLIGFELELKNNNKLAIFSFYISPCTRLNLELFEHLTKIFKNSILICDFNAKNSMWQCQSTDPKEEVLENFISEFNLHVLNCSKNTFNRGKSVMDLSICSNSMRNFFNSHTVLDNQISYHQPTITTFSNIFAESKEFKFKKIDWLKFDNHLSNLRSKMTVLNSSSDIDLELADIFNTINSTLEDCTQTTSLMECNLCEADS